MNMEPTWRAAYSDEVTAADESLRPSWVPEDLVLIPSLSRDGMRRRVWDRQTHLRDWAERAAGRDAREERYGRMNAVVDQQTDMVRRWGPVLEGVREAFVHEVVIMAKVSDGFGEPAWVAANSTSDWLSDEELDVVIDELMFWRMRLKYESD
jgi:hypothetical protein